MTRRNRILAFLLAIAVAGLRSAQAQDAQTQPAPDKGRYTLLDPTPREQMRSFVTDRPTLTQGPFTVDAGHVQVEADLASYSYDRRSPGQAERNVQTLVVADPTVRVGLLNNLEVQLTAEPFVWQQDEEAGRHVKRSGVGDTTLRVKLNLWGDDGDDPGSTAFALLPYVKIPTNTDHLGNHFVEGGLTLPFNVILPQGFQLGAMTEFDVFHNGDDGGTHLEWVNSVVLSKELVKDTLSGYVEFFSAVSREPHAGPVETADVGFTYLLTRDLQLDAGVNLGLTRRAYDFNPFVGLSVRF